MQIITQATSIRPGTGKGDLFDNILSLNYRPAMENFSGSASRAPDWRISHSSPCPVAICASNTSGRHGYIADDPGNRRPARVLQRQLRHFACGTQMVRCRQVVIRPAFDIDRLHHIMPGTSISAKPAHLTDRTPMHPQAMMRVDNLTPRVNDIFVHLAPAIPRAVPFPVSPVFAHFGFSGRIRPSCATLATSTPSRV